MTSGERPGPWTWKTPRRNAEPPQQLRYEPGNWGDVLKGTWAILTAETLAGAGKPLLILDPFAGAPAYPASDAARERVVSLHNHPYHIAQQHALARGELLSTAMLAREASSHGATLRVTDLDDERRRAWTSIENAVVLETPKGEDALSSAVESPGDDDLVLVDPYDFMESRCTLLAPALALARSSAVIVYVYNRAPRSAGRLREYRQFRDAVRAGLPAGARAITGRVPADGRLPRAYHETMLMAPERVIQPLEKPLRERTVALHDLISRPGAFEEE